MRGLGLLRLIKRILAETEIPRIRLSSLQPEDWSPSFYPLWDSGRLCRHLHLSLQSGCGSVLKRMRRRYNVEQYARIVVEAKQALPGVAITTDVIVGFPGETEDEYRQTEEFLRSVGMAGFHVFKYSPRAGTPRRRCRSRWIPRSNSCGAIVSLPWRRSVESGSEPSSSARSFRFSGRNHCPMGMLASWTCPRVIVPGGRGCRTITSESMRRDSMDWPARSRQRELCGWPARVSSLR